MRWLLLLGIAGCGVDWPDETLWTKRFENTIVRNVHVAGEAALVFTAPNDGPPNPVAAYDIDSGRERWKMDIPGEFAGFTESGTMYVVSLADGVPRFQEVGPDGVVGVHEWPLLIDSNTYPHFDHGRVLTTRCVLSRCEVVQRLVSDASEVVRFEIPTDGNLQPAGLSSDGDMLIIDRYRWSRYTSSGVLAWTGDLETYAFLPDGDMVATGPLPSGESWLARITRDREEIWRVETSLRVVDIAALRDARSSLLPLYANDGNPDSPVELVDMDSGKTSVHFVPGEQVRGVLPTSPMFTWVSKTEYYDNGAPYTAWSELAAIDVE